MFLPLTNEKIRSIGAEATVTEILQQPRLWKETYLIIQEHKEQIRDFLSSVSNKHKKVRFVFTGAGTSAYVGEIVVPYLNKVNHNPVWQFDAVATTDLVSSPEYYLSKETPTVMVSFARSGNSPESVAAVEIGKQKVNHFYQIIISCNPNGRLAENAAGDPDTLLLLMPSESNDQGFAMTSSFSSMMLANLLIFQINRIDELSAVVDTISSSAEQLLTELNGLLEEMIVFDFQRIVYLGSGIFSGLARESALKVLELTAGKTVSMFETPLGFRHGPKSILNDKSLVVLFLSENPYTRKYDLDLLKELKNDNLAKTIVLDSLQDDVANENSDWYINVLSSDKEIEDVFAAFIYVTFAQALSVKKSIALGLKVDNPSVDGLVNRVVQGVTIHSLED